MGANRAWSDTCPCGREHGQRTPSCMEPACPTCGRIHDASAAVAVGRFSAGGVTGYRAKGGGPLRSTRREAAEDYCAYARAHQEATTD